MTLAGLNSGLIAGIFPSLSPPVQLAIAIAYTGYAYPSRNEEATFIAENLLAGFSREVLAYMGYDSTSKDFFGLAIATIESVVGNQDPRDNFASLPLDTPFGALTQEDIEISAAASLSLGSGATASLSFGSGQESQGYQVGTAMSEAGQPAGTVLGVNLNGNLIEAAGRGFGKSVVGRMSDGIENDFGPVPQPPDPDASGGQAAGQGGSTPGASGGPGNGGPAPF